MQAELAASVVNEAITVNRCISSTSPRLSLSCSQLGSSSLARFSEFGVSSHCDLQCYLLFQTCLQFAARRMRRVSFRRGVNTTSAAGAFPVGTVPRKARGHDVSS
jgi:hypothetical protein